MAKRNIPKPILPDNFSLMLSERLNTEVVREFKFHPERRWRFDYCIPSVRIAIEIEGAIWTRGRHTSPTGYLKDMEKYNTASAMEWTLLRFSTDQQFTEETFNLIKQTYEARQKRFED